MNARFPNLLTILFLSACPLVCAQTSEKPTPASNSANQGQPQTSDMVLGNVRVVKIEGAGVQLVDTSGQTKPLKEGTFIRQGTKILTDAKSNVVLLFDNGTTVNIKPDSEFSIEKFSQDPFEASGVDYQSLKSEPSKSVTRLNIPEGSIVVDIAKLKKSSSFQIATPVGSAGIRGTSLGVQVNKNDTANPVTIAVSTGVVQVNTATGSRAITGGQAFGIAGSGGFTPNPTGSANLLNTASQTSAEMRQSIPVQPFQGAPQPAPAPPSTGNGLSAAQQQAVQEASEKGTEALVAVVEKLTTESPEIAAEIAGAAADALPVAATDIAAAAAKAAPSSAAQIAVSVAQASPSAAPQIASVVATIVPQAAIQIAQSVSNSNPQAASAIASAVIAAVPSVNATAVQAATQAGAEQSSQPGAATNQPLNTGDQGTSTAGQSLPGASGGTSGGGSGTPPRRASN